jgi:zinc protease
MKNSLVWERKILSNGLILLLYPRSSAITSQLSVAVKYGSNDDSESKIGTAHFLEHMLVGGSQKRIKLLHEIERSGGISNFETTNECTYCAVDVFPERLSEASKVLLELFFDKKFEREKLELERKVILNEIAEASDDLRGKTEETLLKCLFNNHPAKNPVLGSKKTVNQVTIRELEEAHEKHYAPQNMILTLSGKFSETDVETVLEGFQYKENSSLVSCKNRSIEDSKPRKEALSKKSGITQAYLCFGLRTPPAKNADAPVLDLASAILGMGESSRLFVELREKRALTYDFDSMNISCSDYGYFYINCATKIKSLEHTRAIIRDELQKMKTSPVSKAELEKSKNLVLADISRSFDSPHQLPRLLTDLEIYFENGNAVVDYVERIRSFSEQDVMQVSDKYFQEKNYSEAILAPKK